MANEFSSQNRPPTHPQPSTSGGFENGFEKLIIFLP
jgi:hypothetical protein